MYTVYFVGLLFLFLYVGMPFFKDIFTPHIKLNTLHIHSFSIGILFAGLLLIFLEEMYSLDFSIFYICVATLVFTVFLGLRMHSKKKSRLKDVELKTVNWVYEVTHYLVVGFILSTLVKGPLFDLILIGVPFLFLRLSAVYESIHHHQEVHPLLALIVFVGFAAGLFSSPLTIIYNLAIAFVAGGLLYKITHLVQFQKKLNIYYVIFAELLYGGLLILQFLL